MNEVDKSKRLIRAQLKDIAASVNDALKGGDALEALKEPLARLGRGAKLPHWYSTLHINGTLPNLDGKSLGSVLEMVFVAVIEKKFLSASPLVPLRINPARGIDIPSLGLGVKSPSENYCTSEPFFSAYERLVGNEHDAIILLTDYQQRKKKPPLRIQIIKQEYLFGSQVADKNLCAIAKNYRDRLLDSHTSELKKIVRFLAFINQSDWEAKALIKLLKTDLSDANLAKKVSNLTKELSVANIKREKEGKELISEQSLNNLKKILSIEPHWMGLINAVDNWVVEAQKDAGRYPNDTEWERFLRSPLDGRIGMSLALQWRYNFGPLFKI